MSITRWIAVFSLFLFTIPLNGCGFKDVDKRFFAVAIAVDPADNPERLYKVTIKLAIPSPSERFGSNDYTLVSEETDSIAEALRKIKSKIDKELDLGHLKVVILGQSIVERGNVSTLMDWFIRRRDMQKIAWVAAGKPNGKAILDLKPHTERLPSNMLFMSFGKAGTETGYIVSEYLFDFQRRLKERGLDPILPLIETRDNKQVMINRVIVLDKEKQKVLLEPLETKILNSFLDQVSKYDIPVKLNSGFFVIATEKVRGSFSIQRRQGKPVIKLSCYVSGIIEEASVQVVRDDLPKYERIAESQMRLRILSFLQKLQQSNVDPLGFGLRYRATHVGSTERVWKDWLELYPDAEFEVHTKVKITSSGQLG